MQIFHSFATQTNNEKTKTSKNQTVEYYEYIILVTITEGKLITNLHCLGFPESKTKVTNQEPKN